jgi:hypothetical protein
MGLGLGAAFMIFGLGDIAADTARARQLGDAAIEGYAGEPAAVEAATGLSTGLTIYGVTFGADANRAPNRVDSAAFTSKPVGSDLDCLTTAVYYEARGESPRGQVAVAQVVLNRVKHKAFPNSVCAVVYQGAGRRVCQFSFACDGSMRKRREPLAWARARDVAARTLAGAARADIGQATHFHTTSVSPIWAPQMLRVANVGAHVFYKFSPYRMKRAAPADSALDRAVMTAAAGVQSPDLAIATSVDAAIEASLDTGAKPRAEALVANAGETRGKDAVSKVSTAKDATAKDVKGAKASAPKDAASVEAKVKDAKARDAKVSLPAPPVATEEARLTSPQPVGSGAS